MQITKQSLGEGCGKVEWSTACGSYSLKHDEFYYCKECFDKFNNKQTKSDSPYPAGDGESR